MLWRSWLTRPQCDCMVTTIPTVRYFEKIIVAKTRQGWIWLVSVFAEYNLCLPYLPPNSWASLFSEKLITDLKCQIDMSPIIGRGGATANSQHCTVHITSQSTPLHVQVWFKELLLKHSSSRHSKPPTKDISCLSLILPCKEMVYYEGPYAITERQEMPL